MRRTTMIMTCAAALLARAALADEKPAKPQVVIAEISASKGFIKGRVRGLTPKQATERAIVLMIRTDLWYIHPRVGSQSGIATDGTWKSSHIRRGGEVEVGALLVAKDQKVAAQVRNLKDLKYEAAATMVYRPEFVLKVDAKPAERRGPRVSFAQRQWTVKHAMAGPGPNQFSPQAVSVNAEGSLVLTVFQDNNTWKCAEVYLDEPLGFGEYVFQVSGKLAQLDPRIVAGLFVYESDQAEIEALELSRWGDPNNAQNSQFVVQPASKKSVRRFSTGQATALTCSMLWQAGRVQCRCWRGLGAEARKAKPIAEWTYKGQSVPGPSKAKVHMNLWCASGKPPLNGKRAEVIVRAFDFIPLASTVKSAATSGRPGIYVWVEEDGSAVRGFVTGIPPKDVGKFGVKIWAVITGDRDYIQPYEGDIHRISRDMTFRTWTRKWHKLRADLVERRKTVKVVASATYKPGDPKPKRPGNQ